MKLIRTIGKPIHRPIRAAFAILAVAAVPAGAVVVPALAGASTTAATAAAATKCPTGWGSLPEASTYRGSGLLTNVRTGRHACFDRIVFDVKGRPCWFR